MGCGAISGTDQVLKPQLQFRKLKELHKNQQTQIWTCQNHDKEKFSVKVFKKIYIHQENQSMLRNFQLEINRLYDLGNISSTGRNKNFDAKKHLLPYIKAWKDENANLCLTMPLIEQTSLASEVKGKLPGLFNEVAIAKMTQQILRTIKFLRSQGSIFCNFKTTNAFLDKSRQNVRLTDYYNLQEYFKLTENNILKSPMYSAPQNVLFNQYFQQTDIWRVGCFIIELLTCIKPWYKQTTNNQKIIQNLQNHIKPPIPQKISKQCKNFIEKCLETDHNRRTSLEELLTHQFITRNVMKSGRMPKKEEKLSYERENTSVEEIASYNLEVQLLDETPRCPVKKFSLKQKQRIGTQRAYTSQIQPIYNTTHVARKKSNSNFEINNYHKKYETAKVIISESDENVEKKTIQLKNSRNFRTKRIKTETTDPKARQLSYSSPYSTDKKHTELLQLLNKKRATDLLPFDSPQKIPTTNTSQTYSISRKISKTANQRLNKSKKKIPTNQITLNNQILSFNENASTKYWPSPEVSAPFDYLETAEKLSLIMKQIEKEGGDKYYKKPLKLLKQRLKDKHTLRTETSITLEDSRAFLEKSHEGDIEEIDFEGDGNAQTSDQNMNQTELSKISFQTTHQNQVIETLTSKALKQRFETEKNVLRKQREEEKMKWEKELKEGREFIKNQINRRYYMAPTNSVRVSEQDI